MASEAPSTYIYLKKKKNLHRANEDKDVVEPCPIEHEIVDVFDFEFESVCFLFSCFWQMVC